MEFLFCLIIKKWFFIRALNHPKMLLKPMFWRPGVFFRISHYIFIQIGSGIIFFGWISAHLKQFLIFSFFFRVRIPAGAFFWSKIVFQWEKHYFLYDSSLFWQFLPFPSFAPLIRVSSGLVFMKQRPRTKSVRRQHGLGGGTLQVPNKIKTLK